ncbi:MAG: hypothetical protein PUF12_10890 [Thermoflexaceae bacterium]|nr:hypothetical protein [Thermoflexaceae bacterium]
MKKIKTMGAIALAFLVMFSAMMAVSAPVGVLAAEESSSDGNKNSNSYVTTYGNPNEIIVDCVNTMSAGANGVAGIEFQVSFDDSFIQSGKVYSIVSVRPKMDTSGPFIVDNAMYAIAEPETIEQKSKMHCGFVFNVKGNIKTAYYPIAFEVVYETVDSTTNETIYYSVDKAIDICLFGKEEETTSSDTTASVPRIIVTGFETNPEKVMAGQEFELTVHLQNTSNKTAVSNIKVALSSASNEFLPSSGSSTEFIRSMGCGATKDIVIKMKAQGNLEQKPYVLSVKCEYEGEKNAPYTAEESISIPVYQEAKAKVTDIEVMPMSIEVYSQANVMFSINNTGKSTLYNVQVAVDSENPYVQGEESFVGNINSGATGYADFMVTGMAPTMDDGKVKIIISYEDANGEVGTFDAEINLYVYEPVPMDPGMTDNFMDPDFVEEETSGFPWIWLVAGIVVVVIVIIVTVVVIKKKKQKALEEELEDEIS